MFAERVPVAGQIDVEGVRLLTFIRRATGRMPSELHTAPGAPEGAGGKCTRAPSLHRRRR